LFVSNCLCQDLDMSETLRRYDAAGDAGRYRAYASDELFGAIADASPAASLGEAIGGDASLRAAGSDERDLFAMASDEATAGRPARRRWRAAAASPSGEPGRTSERRTVLTAGNTPIAVVPSRADMPSNFDLGATATRMREPQAFGDILAISGASLRTNCCRSICSGYCGSIGTVSAATSSSCRRSRSFHGS
jgi:hypothetical protein